MSKKKIISLIILSVFVIVFLSSLAIIIIKMVKVNGEAIGAEAAVGVFSLIGTIIGAVFVVIELKNTNDVTCCQMLIDLNNYFHDSEKLMHVYTVLDKVHLWSENQEEVWKDVADQDVEFFCTFFENLYLLVEHKIARIKDLDNIFGYRFFLFMNNTHIQEKYLLTTSSGFVNLFKLYDLWTDYREEKSKKGKAILTVDSQNAFAKEYLKKQIYLIDNGVGKNLYSNIDVKDKKILIRDIWFDELSTLINLQKTVHEDMEDGELLVEVTRNEFIESLHLDYVLGAYDNDTLVGAALIVDNRDSERNLGQKFGTPFSEAYTFDIVFVKKEYRGLGLQREFIEIAKRQAKIDGVKTIWTTTSPKNKYSYNNMTAKGFVTYRSNIEMYGGHNRDVLKLDVESK